MFHLNAQPPRLAALLVTSATACIAASTQWAKAPGNNQFGSPLQPIQDSHGRSVFAFPGISLALAALRPRLTKVHWGIRAAPPALGWAGVTLMLAIFAPIPLADATANPLLNPVFAMMLTIPSLGTSAHPVTANRARRWEPNNANRLRCVSGC